VPLSILHISDSDAGGGSAVSAFRLHTGLRAAGHRSRMLVGRPQTGDGDVRSIKRNLAWRIADRGCGMVADRLSMQYVLYPSSFGVAIDPWFREADVVQLFNTHGSYFSHSALPLLSRRRPVVWRLSDMWPFTGHVAYSFDCDRWLRGCGSCPYLSEYPPISRDTTAALWRWKRALYARSRLTVVAPSRWIERLARDSPLLGRFSVRHIPNGVDLGRFRPVRREEARIQLGLDPVRPVVLFSAPDLDDRRKGGSVLEAALVSLHDLDFDLVLAGAGSKRDEAHGARSLGSLEGERLALAYAAADVFVLPTLAENLPNSVLESMACRTPCVSFDVGGVPDAVRHLDTGFLAPIGDATALAHGIRTLLADPELRDRLGARARSVAEREFAAELEASRFADLYAEVTQAGGRAAVA
jgi:glycosyltransferase involved in cell wall biosynthesis